MSFTKRAGDSSPTAQIVLLVAHIDNREVQAVRHMGGPEEMAWGRPLEQAREKVLLIEV